MEAIYVSPQETVLFAASTSASSVASSTPVSSPELFAEFLVAIREIETPATTLPAVPSSSLQSPQARYSPLAIYSSGNNISSPFRVMDRIMKCQLQRKRRVVQLSPSVAKQWCLSGKAAAVNAVAAVAAIATDGKGCHVASMYTHTRAMTTESTKVTVIATTTGSNHRTGTRSNRLRDKAHWLTPTGAAADDSSESQSCQLLLPLTWSSLFRRPASDKRAASTRGRSKTRDRTRRRESIMTKTKTATSSSSSPDAACAAALWKTATDAASGRTYYYHIETRQTQWRKPLELATTEERKAIEEKDAQQRAFFAAMEANILKGLQGGQQQSNTAAITSHGSKRLATEEVKTMQEPAALLPQTLAIPRPMALRVRTISTMDVAVLKDLIGSVATPRQYCPNDNCSSASLAVRSSLRSIVEDLHDDDDEHDESEELHKTQAVVAEFFQSLQEDESEASSDKGSSTNHVAAELDQFDNDYNEGLETPYDNDASSCMASESEFSVDSQADLIKTKYMVDRRPPPLRRPFALSKDQQSVGGSSTSTTSLSLGALGVSDRQLSSGSMSPDASGILSEGGLSILDDEEVLALRQLASAANEMLHLKVDEDETEFDDEEETDSLQGLEISSDIASHPKFALRADSALSDDSDKKNDTAADTAVSSSLASLPMPRPMSLAGGPLKSFPARPSMMRQRRNTCGTIYVSNTLSDPDKDATIMCVCAVFRTHVLQSTMEDVDESAIVSDDYVVFNDLDVLQHRGSRVEFENELPSEPPTLEEVSKFYRDVFRRAKMESDCIIMTLIYVERLIKKTNGKLRPRPENWRSILFACMVLSSKVWDDMSMWNADFSQTCPAGIRFSLQRINELEVAVLSCLEYNVKVKAGEYAKYYFLLRTMLIKSGLGGHDLETMLPLDVEGAKRLQQVSSQYQTSTAFTHQYRSRSMGAITSPRKGSEVKAFPKAGLEQLVKM